MQESWKQIPGFDGYEVSDLGRVRSFWIMGCRARIGDTPRIMQAVLNRRDGRLKVNLRCDSMKRQSFVIASLVWLAFRGERPTGMEIDHIDNNRLNDHLSNLRLATRSQNQANCSGRNRLNKKSRYKGVSPNRSNWQAKIRKNNKIICLGTFDTQEKAACAYNKKAVELFGEYARLNVVGGN